MIYMFCYTVQMYRGLYLWHYDSNHRISLIKKLLIINDLASPIYALKTL